MSLPAQPLAEDFAVSPQLGPEAMAEVAAAGFKSVICNRPDFEGGPEQPTAEAVAAAAKAAGLAWAYLPVNGGFQTEEEARQMAHLLETLPKPVLAYCRSGARSGRLYALAQSLNEG